MKTEVKKNSIIVGRDYMCSNTCNIREYTPDDDDALAAGRAFSHELPLSGEWVKQEEYEWGCQKALCYARWNKATGRVQIEKAHGDDQDLRLDSQGNLWWCLWDPYADKWDCQLIGNE